VTSAATLDGSVSRASSAWGAPPYNTIRVHKVGNIHLTVTNYGILGTQSEQIEDPETGMYAPSCQFPAGSQLEYLFQGALWIGSVVNNDSLVSTGHNGWMDVAEMFPDEYPYGDMQKRSTRPTDADYDPNAISEADYIALYTDTLTDNQYVSQDQDDGRPHIPLGLSIRQESYSWSDSDYEDFVIMKYTLVNIGTNFLNQTYVGIYMDCDVAHTTTYQGSTDDISGSISVSDPLWGQPLLVGWSADNDGDPDGSDWDFHSPRGVLGVALLDEPSVVGPNFNWWVSNGIVTQDWGPRQQSTYQDFGSGGLGTPTGDRNKYYVMSAPERDYDQLWANVDFTSDGWLPPSSTVGAGTAGGCDTRFLLSFGGIDLAPGDSLEFAYVVAMGDSLHTEPTDFADLFDADAPQSYCDVLSFGDLRRNVQAAFELYQSVKSTCGAASLAADTMHIFATHSVAPLPATIYVGDLEDEHTVQEIDAGSLTIGKAVPASSVEVLHVYPGFTGDVLKIEFDARQLLKEFDTVWDTLQKTVTVRGDIPGEKPLFARTEVTVVGHRGGDANSDGILNIADIAYVISFIMAGGAPPEPLLAGDCDCSGSVNISDAVYLISYIFAGGPIPCAACL